MLKGFDDNSSADENGPEAVDETEEEQFLWRNRPSLH